jgi:CRP/FNR family transcriptional regulator, anaerobic regulatory protein
MYSKLFTQISQSLPLKDQLKWLLEQYFVPIKVAKNTILEEEGKVSQHLYFINEGFLRSSYYDDQGHEITTYLATPEQFMASFLSLSQQKVSSENIETITDSTILKISRADFMKIIEKNSDFKEYSLSIFETAFSKISQRANNLATLTAEQRYIQMLNDHGNIIQNVPVQYIASFLGIKPQSLSRIRKQLIK